MKGVLVQLEQINCLFYQTTIALKKEFRKKMASFNEKIKEENIEHEENFRKFHRAIFKKMLTKSAALATNLLTNEKNEEIDDNELKNLIEEIMEERIKLLGEHLN